MLDRSGQLVPNGLPGEVKDLIEVVDSVDASTHEFQLALVESTLLNNLRPLLASRSGAIVGVIDTSEEGAIPLWRLVAERALCINTTAAGGNASLMTLGL